MKDIDPKALRNAFGAFMTGVTVVTTVDENGAPIGFTANSFSSVSLDPPLLLVCPAKSLSTFDAFDRCQYFQVGILGHDQEEVSTIFASHQDDRFAHIDWHSDINGCPQIKGTIASFSCQRERSIDAGDHIILLGRVTEFTTNEGQGLGYGEGGYFSLNMERKAVELQSQSESYQVVAGALVEHEGKLLLTETNVASADDLSLPQIELEQDQPSFDAVKQYLEELLGVSVNVGSVFSIFDHEDSSRSSIYYRVTLDQEKPKDNAAFRFYELEEVAEMSFKSNASNVMMTRYMTERQSGNHGLYIGTETRGKTHKIHGVLS